MWLAFKYAFFAGIATVVNILFQDAVTRIFIGKYDLYIAMSVGTLAGLFTKYVLDKRYIFAYTTHSLMDNGTTFVLYSLMGVFTTLIFWGTELTFEFIFGTKGLRYMGAVIGLTSGYTIKYLLDKRFVFIKSKNT
jgi:putative flippase GtrA